MNDERKSTLYRELRQLCAQYKAEVTGRRKTWPNSIHERVAELRALGASDRDMATQFEVSANTLA